MCDELLEIYEKESKTKKKTLDNKFWMDKNKYEVSKTIIGEIHDNNPHEFKSVIRSLPEQFEELLLVICLIIARNDIFIRSFTNLFDTVTIYYTILLSLINKY